jgi:hypothetical protein
MLSGGFSGLHPSGATGKQPALNSPGKSREKLR